MAMLLGVAAMTSCSSEPESTTYDYEKADSLSVDYENELRNIRSDIKDAGNLYLVLREIGVPFNNDLVLPASKYSGAAGRKKQAVSLGAAGADLNYITMFEQHNQSGQYVKSILDLALKLGIESAFDEELLQELVNVADTSVSFQERSKKLMEAYRNAEDHLYSEERAQLTTMIVAGGWVESMYIASSIGATIESQREVDAEIWNMIFGAEKVLKMLEVFEDDPDCAAVANDIRNVMPLLDDMKEMRVPEVHQRFEELSRVMETLRNKLL